MTPAALQSLLVVCQAHGVTRLRLSESGEPVEIELLPAALAGAEGSLSDSGQPTDALTAAARRLVSARSGAPHGVG